MDEIDYMGDYEKGMNNRKKFLVVGAGIAAHHIHQLHTPGLHILDISEPNANPMKDIREFMEFLKDFEAPPIKIPVVHVDSEKGTSHTSNVPVWDPYLLEKGIKIDSDLIQSMASQLVESPERISQLIFELSTRFKPEPIEFKIERLPDYNIITGSLREVHSPDPVFIPGKKQGGKKHNKNPFRYRK